MILNFFLLRGSTTVIWISSVYWTVLTMPVVERTCQLHRYSGNAMAGNYDSQDIELKGGSVAY